MDATFFGECKKKKGVRVVDTKIKQRQWNIILFGQMFSFNLGYRRSSIITYNEALVYPYPANLCYAYLVGR